MSHLYEDKQGVIHSCESADFDFYQNPIKLVWTRCEKDVPADQSFKSNEIVTCKYCEQLVEKWL